MKRLVFVMIGCMMMTACAGARPDNLGVVNGKLTACPSSPNCVNSQAADEDHAVAAFTYEGSRQEAFERLKKAIASCERMSIIEEKEDYLRVECTSAIMRFVDDVEFYFPEEQVIQVRSASRCGYSDLGVNRDRVEHLRKLFDAKAESTDAQ